MTANRPLQLGPHPPKKIALPSLFKIFKESWSYLHIFENLRTLGFVQFRREDDRDIVVSAALGVKRQTGVGVAGRRAEPQVEGHQHQHAHRKPHGTITQ